MDDSRYEKEQLVAGVFHALRARKKRPLDPAQQRLWDAVQRQARERLAERVHHREADAPERGDHGHGGVDIATSEPERG